GAISLVAERNEIGRQVRRPLACAGIGIVVALRTLPKQAPPTLCYLQPGFAVEIVFLRRELASLPLPPCVDTHRHRSLPTKLRPAIRSKAAYGIPSSLMASFEI